MRGFGWMAVLLPIGFFSSVRADTAVSFLDIGIGARAAGLSSAYTAIADDSTSLYWNPAGLSLASSKEISTSHTELGNQTRHDFVGYVHPFQGSRAFGIGAIYLSHGAIEGRAADRSATGDFTASDRLLSLGLAQNLVGGWSLGGTVKALQEQIADVTATGFAADLGISRFVPGSKWRAGLALLNAGPQVKFANQSEQLPVSLSAGAGYQATSFLLVSADVKRNLIDARTRFGIGAELQPTRIFAVRAGYQLHAAQGATKRAAGTGNDSSGNLAGLGLGFGMKFSRAALDYSFAPSAELSDVHRISAALKF